MQKKKNLASRLRREAERVKVPIEKPSPGGWPYVTGEIKADFAPFNHDPGDDGYFSLLRPPTVVKTQSSIA